MQAYAPGRAPRTIGVLGGGSAGYITALYLKKILPEAQISLIESTRLPVIGVGEAATPLLLAFLHTKLGFPMQEFFQEAKPTLKLGIKFLWGRSGDHHFNVTFGRADFTSALGHSGELNDLSFASMLMEQEKTPFARATDAVKPIDLARGYAYHVDNRNFLAYLKRKLLESGCRHIDTEVEQVTLAADAQTVEAMTGKDGQVYRYDLIFDCSGFGSMLLGKALGTPWISYAKSLKTDRAVLGMAPNPGEIKPYTTSATLRHGWLWNTPMQQEDHLGYVFSSQHCSDDEALKELQEHCPVVNQGRVVHFRTGRHGVSWRGNVIGLGNAYAFIEPLQSTGLHMILRQLRMVSKVLVGGDGSAEEKDRYNASVNGLWDNLRWFIALHFKFNRRMDTAFWRSCREEVDVSGVQEYLDYFDAHGPLSSNPESEVYASMNYDQQFSPFAHDAILLGCGLRRGVAERQEAGFRPAWPAGFRMRQMLVGQCVGQREAIAYMENHGCEFRTAAPLTV